MAILALTAKLGVDGRGFKAGLKEAELAGNRFAGNLRGQLAAAFSVAAAAGFLKNIVDTVGRIKDLADQSNVTTDEMQKIDAALKRNGLSFESFQQVLQKVGAARREAIEQDGDMRAIFKRTGVSVDMLNSSQTRNIDIVLRQIATIKDLNLNSKEQLEITDIWGVKSAKLITALQGLDQIDIEIFSQQEIQVLDDANKKLEEMIRNLKVIAASGIVEGSRNPVKFVADYLSSIAPLAPVPAGLNLLGRLMGTWSDAFDNSKKSGPLSPLDIVNANIAKSNRPGAENMYELNKTDKEKRAKAIAGASLDFGGSGVKPGGFGAAGGFSAGFISGFDPKTFIEQSQLQELQKINEKLEAIKNKASRGGDDGAYQ